MFFDCDLQQRFSTWDERTAAPPFGEGGVWLNGGASRTSRLRARRGCGGPRQARSHPDDLVAGILAVRSSVHRERWTEAVNSFGTQLSRADVRRGGFTDARRAMGAGCCRSFDLGGAAAS